MMKLQNSSVCFRSATSEGPNGGAPQARIARARVARFMLHRYSGSSTCSLSLEVVTFVTTIEIVTLCYNNFNATATVCS